MVQSRFKRTGLDVLWWAGGVLCNMVADRYRFGAAMESVVFFFGSASDADGGFVARLAGAEQESYGFGSRSHMVAAMSASSVEFGRFVVEIAL